MSGHNRLAEHGQGPRWTASKRSVAGLSHLWHGLGAGVMATTIDQGDCSDGASEHWGPNPFQPIAAAVAGQLTPIGRQLVPSGVVGQPDIVLIVTDQQRHDQVGWASDGFFETPTLDGLAERGVVFRHAYSAGATCVPGRVGLLTGVQLRRLVQPPQPVWPTGVWTVAHGLRAAGYQTALIGKMHFSPVHADHGFEVHRSCEHLVNIKHGLRPDGTGDVDDYHQWLVDQGKATWGRLEVGRPPTIDRAPPPADAGTASFPFDIRYHPTTWIENEVRTFVDGRDDDRPLFLVISFPHPHVPLNPLGPYEQRYAESDVEIPLGAAVNDGLPDSFREATIGGSGPWGNWRVADHGEQELRERQTKIRALIRHIDDALARLLTAFPLDRTLIAVTSDHGDYGGRRGLAGKSPWIPFDDLVRVPLVVAGAGVEGGREVTTTVQSGDLVLTFCDVAGVDVPHEEFDSQSLLPLLHHPAHAEDPDRTAVFTYNPHWPGLCRGRMKLIERRMTDEQALFDLDADPDESVNLADDPAFAAELAHLREQLTLALDRGAPAIELPTPAR